MPDSTLNVFPIAASTLCFSRLSLTDALREIAGLGFRSVDLGAHEGWAHLNPSEIAQDPARAADDLRQLLFRFQLTPVAINAGLRAAGEEEAAAQLRGLADFAREAGIPVLTVGAPASGTDPREAAGRLSAWTDAARERGVTLTVETHINTIAEIPAVAVELCESAPGLGLTLDPSHFIAGPWSGRSWEEVYPHVRHVHLRDADVGGWDKVQVAVGTGRLIVSEEIDRLRRVGYDGALAVEVIDTIGCLDIPLELRAMRTAIEGA